MVKRLFLFAGYDKYGFVDKTLLHYLRCLSDLGDIVFIMDSDANDSELDKIKQIPHVLYASAKRHGEYDFGSYKRAYQWADDNGLIKNYDWIYLVNDSVYGPLFNVEPLLTELESSGADLVGPASYRNSVTLHHVQSWFVGMSQRVATSDFLRDFMRRVSGQPTKDLIILKYEVGLSRTIMQHGYQMYTKFNTKDGDVRHDVYEAPVYVLESGIPFIKKQAIHQVMDINRLYQVAVPSIVEDIQANIQRIGTKFTGYKEYKKIYRLTVFSIPLITIYRDVQNSSCYKIYLFDFIPVFKSVGSH